jgi:3-dehydroquinate dehydratase
MKGIFLILRDEFNHFRLSFWKHHVVICGLGEKGKRIANDLIASGQKVVVIESQKDAGYVSAVRGRHGIILFGNAQEAILLKKARIQEADKAFVVTSNDEVNLAIGAVAQRLLVSSKSEREIPFQLNVAIQDPWMKRLFNRHPLFAKPEPSVECRIFNVYEKAANAMLRECPPDRAMPGQPFQATAHALVIGFGWMGQSLALQYLKSIHLLNESASRITIMGNAEAVHQMGRFMSEFRLGPDIPDQPPMACLRLDSNPTGTFESGLVEEMRRLQDGIPITAIYLCLEDDAEALHAAHLIRKQLDPTIPIAICSLNGEVTRLASEIEDPRHVNFHFFNLLDIGCAEETLVQPMLDRLARTIHEDWCATMTASGEGNANLIPWESLSDLTKEANRQQAAQIQLKIRCMQAHLEPLEFPDLPMNLEPMMERLAQMEHRRWMAEKWLSGWSSGPVRDDAKLIHNCLVPWEQLSNSEKEKDRQAVRQIPNLLESSGYKVVQDGSPR